MSAEAHSRHRPPLRAFLAAASDSPATMADRIALLQQLAESIRQWHTGGRVHRTVDLDHICCDAQGKVLELLAPPEVVSFGGPAANAERTPIALRTEIVVDLPESLAECRRMLTGAGIPCSPEQIDLYQWGSVACRVLTGQSLAAYLRSPTANAQIPVALRQIVDRALSFNHDRAFQNAGELAVSLTTLTDRDAPTVMHDQSPARQSGDTDASVMSAVADTSCPPEHPPRSSTVSNRGEPLPWATLGHYELVRRIGHGGMGDVYLGYERTLDRHVAIKVLPAELARESEFVRRFYAEASAAARVVHPHIIPIYYIGEDHGHHYFVMQYVEGDSLAALLRERKRLSIDQTLDLLDQVLSGLEAAHAQGLIHRDIKPGNILLDHGGVRVVLADFGLAKSLRPDATGHTATGVVMGTVDYLSPEQGRGHVVDHRSDLYSLGVLAYQLLSGQLPFSADSPTALIFQHVYEPPRSLSEVASNVSAALSAVVAKLLAKSPDARHSSAAAVRADLAAVRQGRPLPSGAEVALARDPGVFSRPVTGADAPRSVIVQAPQFVDEPELPPDEPPAPPPVTWQGRFRAWLGARNPEAAAHLANTQLQVDGAVAEYERRRDQLAALVREAESVLAELRTQESVWRGPDVRAGDTALRTANELQEARQAQESQLETMRVNLAQVNARLATLKAQRDVLNARLRAAQAQLPGTGRESAMRRSGLRVILRLIAAAVLITIPALLLIRFIRSPSPIAATLAPPRPLPSAETPYVAEPWQSPAALAAAALARGATRDERTGIEKHLSISPDGTLLAMSAFDPNLPVAETCAIQLWDLTKLREVRALAEPHRSLGLGLSPDGKWIVSAGLPADGSNRKEVKVWDAATGSVKRIVPAALEPDSDLDIGISTERSVACVLLNDPVSSVGLFDLNTGAMDAIRMPMPQDDAWSLATAANGKLVAVGVSQVGHHRTDIDIYDLESRRMVKSLKTENAVRGVKFSGDGRWLMGLGRTLCIWNTATWELAHSLPYSFKGQHASAISHDGSHVALRSYGRVTVWNVADQSPKELSIGDRCLDMAFANGSILVVALPHAQLTFFDVATGRRQLTVVPEGVAAMLPTQVDAAPLWTESLGRTPVAISVGAGDNVAAIYDDGQYELRSATSGNLIESQSPGRPGERTLLSPDGLLLAGVGQKHAAEKPVLQVWNAQSQSAVKLDGDATTAGSPLAFVNDGQKLLTSISEGERQTLVFWNVSSGAEDVRVSIPSPATSAQFVHRSGKLIAAARSDSGVMVVRLLDATSGPAPEWEPMATAGRLLGFHPLNHWLMLGAEDGAVRIYDVDTGTNVARFGTRDGPVEQAVFDGPGRRCATVGTEGVCIWDMSLGYVRMMLPVPHVTKLGFSHDGQRLVIADDAAQMQMYDTSFAPRQLDAGHWLQAVNSRASDRNTLVPKAVSHNPKQATTRDGRLTARVQDGGLHLIETTSGKVLHDFGGVRSVLSVAFSPDDRLAASGGFDRKTVTGDVRLWNLRSGREIRRFPGHVHYCWSIAFSEDGKQLVTGATGFVHLWDVSSGQQIRQIPAGRAICEQVAFSNDGRWIIADSKGGEVSFETTAFDRSTGEPLVTVRGGYPQLLLEDLGLLRDRRFGDLEFIARAQ